MCRKQAKPASYTRRIFPLPSLNKSRLPDWPVCYDNHGQYLITFSSVRWLVELSRILVISDTHFRSTGALSPGLLRAIEEAEYVVHCGDFVSRTVVNELRRLSRHFIGVYGNADPDDVRRMLPAETTFSFGGKKIAVIHPYWGGDGYRLEEELTTRYPRADVILFGHTHVPYNLMMNGTLLLNPGQAYASFMVSASVGILTINEDGVSAEILNVD